MNEIEELELVFLLLLFFIVVFGIFARKLGTPYPIVMVVGGLLPGLVPGIPEIALNPDLVFLVVLPPLLYAAAWTTSWRDFQYNFVSIFLLAFGLVGFTVVAVAMLAPGFFAGFDWRLGFVLGAVIAPTDAIAAPPLPVASACPAASSISSKARASSTMPPACSPYSSPPPSWCRNRSPPSPAESSPSPGSPAAASHWAVTCGFLLSRRSANFFSPSVRLQIWSVWQSLNFVLNGLVFVLIGLQLPAIRASIRGYSLLTLLIDGAVFSALVIVVRLVWTFPGAGISWFVRTRFLRQLERPPRLRAVFVLGWTGMRGVVSLAAALSLPAVLADCSPFPQRNIIIFLTFCVIFVTLVLQGVTLPPLIRALGLAGAAGPNCEEQDARRIAIEAAVSHLNDAKDRDRTESAARYEDVAGTINNVWQACNPVLRLRDEGRINDEVLRRIERELGLNESRLSSSSPQPPAA